MGLAEGAGSPWMPRVPGRVRWQRWLGPLRAPSAALGQLPCARQARCRLGEEGVPSVSGQCLCGSACGWGPWGSGLVSPLLSLSAPTPTPGACLRHGVYFCVSYDTV